MQQGPPAPPPPDQNAMSEDLLNALASTPEDQAMLEGLLEQRAQAEALRDTTLPEMRGGGGRVQTAANPLEFLATGIKQYRGAKKAKELEGEVGATRKTIGGKQGTYTKEAAKQGGLSVLFKKRKSDEDKD
jgi:hypothetical protein